MTAQLDVEALVGLLERATALPWAFDVDDPDPMFQPNYCIYPVADDEHSIAEVNGQINKSSDAALIVAAVNALPALLAHIAGEDARVAAAVAGAVEASNKAWAKTLDSAPTQSRYSACTVCWGTGYDISGNPCGFPQHRPTIRETPSAE